MAVASCAGVYRSIDPYHTRRACNHRGSASCPTQPWGPMMQIFHLPRRTPFAPPASTCSHRSPCPWISWPSQTNSRLPPKLKIHRHPLLLGFAQRGGGRGSWQKYASPTVTVSEQQPTALTLTNTRCSLPPAFPSPARLISPHYDVPCHPPPPRSPRLSAWMARLTLRAGKLSWGKLCKVAASTSACLEWLLRPETVAGIRDGAPDYAQLAARLCKLSAVYAGMPGFCTGISPTSVLSPLAPVFCRDPTPLAPSAPRPGPAHLPHRRPTQSSSPSRLSPSWSTTPRCPVFPRGRLLAVGRGQVGVRVEVGVLGFGRTELCRPPPNPNPLGGGAPRTHRFWGHGRVPMVYQPGGWV